MTDIRRASQRRVSVVAALLAGSVISMAVGEDALAAPKAASVKATYVINFNGISLGKFHFQSKLNGANYALTGRAKMKLLFGAFKWDSTTSAQGLLKGASPQPASYTFNYKSKKKSGSTKMSFAGGTVEKVVRLPRKSANGRVPVTPQHLRNVFDPMSAIMAMTLANGIRRNPCRQTVPVFDGKQRFNIVMTPKRRSKVRDKAGRATPVYVCKAKYVPVSGHKMNRETKYMASTDDIEVWFTPLEQANMFMPVNVVLPTMIGSASIRTKDLRVETTARQRIALSF